jgi:hypothetical protein
VGVGRLMVGSVFVTVWVLQERRGMMDVISAATSGGAQEGEAIGGGVVKTA